MSRQLAISSAFASFAMAAMALFVTPDSIERSHHHMPGPLSGLQTPPGISPAN